VFDPDRGRGRWCEHLLDLVAVLDWKRRGSHGRARPGGGLVAAWQHPLFGPGALAERARWTSFLSAVLAPGSCHPLRPRTPDHSDDTRLDGPLPGPARGRSNAPWLWGRVCALFAADAEEYSREARAGFARYCPAADAGVESPAVTGRAGPAGE
jgi:hypothetical protein